MPTPNQNNALVPVHVRNACNRIACSDQGLSVISIVCRICYDNEKEEPLITPCRCKGTVAFVHRSCLETWLAESNTTTCELCHQIFKTERTPKYTSKQAIWKWLTRSRGNPRQRGVRGDLLACGLLTPIAILITYICLFSADYYNQNKFNTVPAARWTSLSLLFMIAVMLIGYYLWVYSVIRVHARMWYNWWQRECTVKYVPPSTINICSQCPSSVQTPNNTPLSASPSRANNDCCRGESICQIENEEEIYHEALDRVCECRMLKASTVISSDIVLDVDEKFEDVEPGVSYKKSEPFETENIPLKTRSSLLKADDQPMTLIKNEGYIYIININEPNYEIAPNSQMINNPACLDTPVSAFSCESVNSDQMTCDTDGISSEENSPLQDPSNVTNIEIEINHSENRKLLDDNISEKNSTDSEEMT